MDATFGVHSEVGQLRKVMVYAPGPAHQRLTPSNCDDLLFDEVLWVDNAKRHLQCQALVNKLCDVWPLWCFPPTQNGGLWIRRLIAPTAFSCVLRYSFQLR